MTKIANLQEKHKNLNKWSVCDQSKRKAKQIWPDIFCEYLNVNTRHLCEYPNKIAKYVIFTYMYGSMDVR